MSLAFTDLAGFPYEDMLSKCICDNLTLEKIHLKENFFELFFSFSDVTHVHTHVHTKAVQEYFGQIY